MKFSTNYNLVLEKTEQTKEITFMCRAYEDPKDQYRTRIRKTGNSHRYSFSARVSNLHNYQSIVIEKSKQSKRFIFADFFHPISRT